MGAALLVGTALPVQAATYANGDTSGSITVTANVTSSYSITLPATLELILQDDGSWANDYTVGVKANITGAESVTVTPDATFEMIGATDSVNNRATAGVTQEKTVWKNTPSAANEIAVNGSDYSNTTGRVSVNFPAIDSYTGTLNFTFAKGQ